MQSRIKELEKIERIEIPEDEPVIHFKFPQPAPSGRIVAEADGLGKSYGPKHVFSNARFTIERGDRVALVGVNGAGKSTLIKLLTGVEDPTEGTIKLGHNVVSEYFAQDQYKVLDPDARMLDDISRAALKVPESELRSLLGCFLFSGDDVFKQLGVLSGGERNRFALARILVSPSNFLLLDEPTNHLDMRAKDVLLDAIAAFSGTVVFVSHDRYFIDRLATRVIEVENGVIDTYEGNYEDYLRKKEELAAQIPSPISIPLAAFHPRSQNRDPGHPALLVERSFNWNHHCYRGRGGRTDSEQQTAAAESDQAEADGRPVLRFSRRRFHGWRLRSPIPRNSSECMFRRRRRSG